MAKKKTVLFSLIWQLCMQMPYIREALTKEGWKALRSLSDTALDFDTSHIYPGIPEYFRSDGRGMYHYLTGAASWYLLP